MNNQVSGFQYDAAGNLQNDMTHSYTYDAEGNMVAVDGGSTAKYGYDASNHRVRLDIWSGAFEELYNLTGQKVVIWNASSGSVVEEDTHLGAQPLAAYLGGALFFEHQDWLGTERMLTDGAGNTAGSYLSLPFGDGFTDQGTDLDPYHFAGMDHDYESGLDHAQFREYSSAGGRWLSPDPYSGSYDWTDPQSLNRYSYVLNNPLAFLDPTGLSCTDGVGTYGPSSSGDININGNCFPSDGNPDDSWIINDLTDIGEFIAGFFGGHPHIHVGPRPGVAPNNGIASKLECAAKYGQAHSIGAFFGGGPVASFLGGNSVSSILNYGLGLSSSIGPGLGLPTNDVLRLAGKESISGLSSPGGMARSAGIVTAVNSFLGTDSSIISITGETSIASFAGVATNGLTAVRAASVVGVAKFTYDGAAVTYGYFGDCSE